MKVPLITSDEFGKEKENVHINNNSIDFNYSFIPIYLEEISNMVKN